MSYMFEVFYPPPADLQKEAGLTQRVERFDGRLSFREGDGIGTGSICLTFEFDDLKQAESAAEALRRCGEHVEGPVDYAS